MVYEKKNKKKYTEKMVYEKKNIKKLNIIYTYIYMEEKRKSHWGRNIYMVRIKGNSSTVE